MQRFSPSGIYLLGNVFPSELPKPYQIAPQQTVHPQLQQQHLFRQRSNNKVSSTVDTTSMKHKVMLKCKKTHIKHFITYF